MNGKHSYTSTSSAFDSVHRESIWTIMKAYEIPEKIIRVVKNLLTTLGVLSLTKQAPLTGLRSEPGSSKD